MILPQGGDQDGQLLLTGPAVQPLLEQATREAGGELLDWRLDHLDHDPDRSTTATYAARVRWVGGEREELIGCSIRAHGPDASDDGALLLDDGQRQAAVWIHPFDPDLPGLARAAFTDQVADLLGQHRLLPHPVRAVDVELRMVGYRPRRRAVVRVQAAGHVFYVKVLRPDHAAGVVRRHEMLATAGICAPEVLAVTEDHLLVLRELPGRPLSRAIFDEHEPCGPDAVIGLLDRLPAEVCELERRPAWSESVQHYARIISESLPEQEQRLDWMASTITQGLAGLPGGQEPTHGDLHEGQLHVAGGRVVGLLDVDTLGPGRRADDLACLVAHLTTVQRMDATQTERVHHLIRTWVPAFDERVDPTELRLRTAAVVISLATGPRRGLEEDWQAGTVEILDAAEALVRQVG